MSYRFYKGARKAGNMEELRIKLWRAVMSAESILKKAETHEQATKAIYAVVAACGAYNKIMQTVEFEERIKQLEERQRREEEAAKSVGISPRINDNKPRWVS